MLPHLQDYWVWELDFTSSQKIKKNPLNSVDKIIYYLILIPYIYMPLFLNFKFKFRNKNSTSSFPRIKLSLNHSQIYNCREKNTHKRIHKATILKAFWLWIPKWNILLCWIYFVFLWFTLVDDFVLSSFKFIFLNLFLLIFSYIPLKKVNGKKNLPHQQEFSHSFIRSLTFYLLSFSINNIPIELKNIKFVMSTLPLDVSCTFIRRTIYSYIKLLVAVTCQIRAVYLCQFIHRFI